MCRSSSRTPGKVILIKQTWVQADTHAGLQLAYEPGRRCGGRVVYQFRISDAGLTSAWAKRIFKERFLQLMRMQRWVIIKHISVSCRSLSRPVAKILEWDVLAGSSLYQWLNKEKNMYITVRYRTQFWNALLQTPAALHIHIHTFKHTKKKTFPKAGRTHPFRHNMKLLKAKQHVSHVLAYKGFQN